MHEADPFQALSEEDRARMIRRLLRLFVPHWLGEPDKLTSDRLENIVELSRLERIYDRAVEASSWHDLLSTE